MQKANFLLLFIVTMFRAIKGTIKPKTQNQYVIEIEKCFQCNLLTVPTSTYSTRNIRNALKYLYQNTVNETFLRTKKL